MLKEKVFTAEQLSLFNFLPDDSIGSGAEEKTKIVPPGKGRNAEAITAQIQEIKKKLTALEVPTHRWRAMALSFAQRPSPWLMPDEELQRFPQWIEEHYSEFADMESPWRVERREDVTIRSSLNSET